MFGINSHLIINIRSLCIMFVLLPYFLVWYGPKYHICIRWFVSYRTYIILWTWWHHAMETFYWPFVRGIYWLPVDCPYKGSVMRTYGSFLLLVWASYWRNSQAVGYLRHFAITWCHCSVHKCYIHTKQPMRLFWSLVLLRNEARVFLCTHGEYILNQVIWAWLFYNHMFGSSWP